MKNLNNKVVALTGAASGIGRALACELAAQGCHLALADKNMPGLMELHAALLISSDSKTARHISLHQLDVADREAVYAWADDVASEHGHVDIVINNAGVAAIGSIDEISIEDFDWVFDIVFYGVLYGSKAFLPYLKTRDEANIVNISSVNAFFPFPNNGPYNCAKHAVKALNQTLIQELAGTAVKVTSVHPGGIKTNIANSSRYVGLSSNPAQHANTSERFNKTAMTTPEQAASVIIKGIKKDKQRLLVGFDAYVIDILCRLFPQGFSNWIGRWLLKDGAGEVPH